MGNVGLKWQWVLVGSFLLNGLGIGTAIAQPIPDETLGEERSEVREFNSAIDLIEGGATRGRNLFHSFREFNIDTERAAYFIHQLGIENIFSRVTGETRSEINGLLGVLSFENGGFIGSNANLFLINPNGIVFGPNSSLDIGGSFVATTADGIQFGDRGFFNATNPEVPSLLTVDPSALFFNQLPQPIVNRSQTLIGTTPLGVELFGLNVRAGESLVLAGGNILMDGGINAVEGRVELGGLAASGRIDLVPVSDGFQLQFPADAVRSDVFLSGATVNVAGGDRGSIAIYAQDLTLTNTSLLRAGYEAGSGTTTSQAGDIVLDAMGTVLIDQSSTVANTIRQDAIGNGGDVNINAASLTVNANGTISNGVVGQGNGGDININVDGPVAFNYSSVLNSIGSNAIGTGGDITVDAGSVSITNGTQINSNASGQGSVGNITINARDTVAIDGISSDGFRSGIFRQVGENATGNMGNIIIDAESFLLTNGARIQSDVLGRGNAGNVEVTARDTVSLDDGAILSEIDPNAIGNSGSITIDTGSLFLTNGSQLRTTNAGQGNAADVTVNARDSISLSDRASIITNLAGRGNAGSVRLNAGNAISLSGENTGIISPINPSGVGNAGTIVITTGSLAVTDNAQVFTNSFGQGDAGTIQITARDAVFVTTGADIASSVGRGVQGSTGDIFITADSLTLADGAGLASNLFGRSNLGNTGDIQLTIDNTITIRNTSFVSASVFEESVGNGGNITISTGSLSVTNSSGLSTITFGQENAGNIQITARDRVTFAGRSSAENAVSSASASVAEGAVGNGGNITITTGSLLVNEGLISTGTSGQGDAGNIEVTARDTVTLVNNGNVASETGSNAIGDAGNIRMDARNIRLLQNASLVTLVVQRSLETLAVARVLNETGIAETGRFMRRLSSPT